MQILHLSESSSPFSIAEAKKEKNHNGDLQA